MLEKFVYNKKLTEKQQVHELQEIWFQLQIWLDIVFYLWRHNFQILDAQKTFDFGIEVKRDSLLYLGMHHSTFVK